MDVSFISRASIPDKKIYFKELKVKHLKVIYKSLLGDVLDADTIFNNLDYILSDIVNTDINDLNFLEYFILLFEVRCNSIGNLLFTQSTENSNTKIEINISRFIDIIKQIDLPSILLTDTISNTSIVYRLPTINELFEFKKQKTLHEIYQYFLQDVLIDGISVFDTNQNKLNTLNLLPAKVTSLALKQIQNILKELNKVNLLSTTNGLTDKLLPINCNIDNLSFIVKLLFGDQLLSLYENIFTLCKIGNLSPEYIENLTPGEYLLYLKKLEALTKQQNSSEQDKLLPDYDPLFEG
jgi:hypothetical protein